MCFGSKKIYVGSADVDKFEYDIEPCPKCTEQEAESFVIQWE